MPLGNLLDWILHLDKHLNELIDSVGPGWVYIVLLAIIFCETGLVILPFLPGDSLLFAVGALCATDDSKLNIYWMVPMLTAAAIVGDAVNYWIGFLVGPRVFRSESSIWLNRNHLLRAQAFYEKYGSKTIILARFVPIVRTFAPFVAGIGKMNFGRFWLYNILGGFVWVALFLIAGYMIGHWGIIKNNFSLVTVGIILLSVVPILFEWRKAKIESAKVISNP